MKDLEEEISDLAHELAKAVIRAVLASVPAPWAISLHQEPREERAHEAVPEGLPALEKVRWQRVPTRKEGAVLKQVFTLLLVGPMLSRDLQSYFPDRMRYLGAMRVALARGWVERTMTAQGKVYSLPKRAS